MFQKYIEELKPKPRFTLDWYKDEDLYSDGDIENIIVKIIAENSPEEYVEAVHKNYCWPTYYHLSHIRGNILNWYPFKENADVLEIGCGFGAITGTLCDRCNSVTAVELSKRRGTGALLRCREKENLEIIIGNLNDIEFSKKFDYITLIGVLEYQGKYTEGADPYSDFLKKVKGLLKPDGKLLIAIENQYGLKYWCGAREDHTSIPFEGMNQYRFSGNGVRTFSKDALDKLIKRSGFNRTFFYYPMPDYKLPEVIYSQDCIPTKSNMMNVQYYYVPNEKTLVANEKNIYEDIIKNGVFEFFANSFLVECSDDVSDNRVTFASMNTRRYAKYQLMTRFWNKAKVEKIALRGGNFHLELAQKNVDELANRGLKVCDSKYDNGVLETKYVDEMLFEDFVLDAYKKRDLDSVTAAFDKLYDEIIKSSDHADWKDNLVYHMGDDVEENEDLYGVILRKGYLDMILRNAFYIDEEMYWFDQEWALENVPAKYILFRAICEFANSFFEPGKDQEEALIFSELINRYSLGDCWKIFSKIEQLFIGTVLDSKFAGIHNMIVPKNYDNCISNINKLIN